MIEKTVNTEVKTSLQPPFGTREIGSRCPKGYRPLAKKDKDKINQEYQDRDKINLIILLLLIQVSLRPKHPKRINVIKEAIKDAIQLLGSTLLRLQKKTKTRIRPKN